MIDTSIRPETVILVSVVSGNADAEQVKETLDELAFLVDTAGGVAVKRFVQRLPRPDSRTYVGTGRLADIKTYVNAENIDAAVFDDELSASQIRNLERELECKILDRTTLILDIFAKRARTSVARTQVELAQYEYLLPRLTRLWVHLTHQRGGMGMRGPGEKEIETDRRIIRDRIALLKDKLRDIDKQKVTQRKSRDELVRVALVGYTNVGKSTLLNLLSKSDVFAEDKLFATLDATVRKVVIGNLPFLLSDTVGFIRKLPHSLVNSFKSTLDEVREADLLLHVVDISHPWFEEQMNVVKQTLMEIGAADKPTVVVFNKIDLYSFTPKEPGDLSPETPENLSLEDLGKTWIVRSHEPALFISAKHRIRLEELRQMLYEEVKKIHVQRYPHNNFLF